MILHEIYATQINVSKTEINVLTPMKRKEFYVPPNFYNKLDDRGNLLCRVAECNKQTKVPFRYFCCKTHAREFARWHFLHCTWIGVRLAIFKRDDYTCQKCGKSWDKEQIIKLTKRNMRFLNFADVFDVKGTDLECDHIQPVVQLLEDFRMKTKIRNASLPNSSNNLLFAKERLLSYDNLRTLCSKCHGNVTVSFTITRHYESKVRSSAETAKAMIKYFAIGKDNKKGPKLG
jgi:5-methylcytosine-specific restriction endonuclease McrA